eukprot:331097-Chlamydomonas_euryale.AAC.1
MPAVRRGCAFRAPGPPALVPGVATRPPGMQHRRQDRRGSRADDAAFSAELARTRRASNEMSPLNSLYVAGSVA